MSLPITFKAQALARGLQQNVQLQIAGAVVTNSFDTNNNPILQIVASGETIFVQIQPETTDRIDSLGLPQNTYTPNVATILEDSTPTSLAVRYAVHMMTAALGARTDIYEIHPLPASYSLAGATFIESIYPDPINKLTNQI